jgi:hypothetical protein
MKLALLSRGEQGSQLFEAIAKKATLFFVITNDSIMPRETSDKMMLTKTAYDRDANWPPTGPVSTNLALWKSDWLQKFPTGYKAKTWLQTGPLENRLAPRILDWLQAQKLATNWPFPTIS